MADQILHQKCHRQLAVEPGHGAVGVVLGQVPELRQGLEALEDKLDLPAGAVPLQNVRVRELRGGEGCEDDHVLGELQGLRLQLRALSSKPACAGSCARSELLPGLVERTRARPPLCPACQPPGPPTSGPIRRWHRLDGRQPVERRVLQRA